MNWVKLLFYGAILIALVSLGLIALVDGFFSTLNWGLFTPAIDFLTDIYTAIFISFDNALITFSRAGAVVGIMMAMAIINKVVGVVFSEKT